MQGRYKPKSSQPPHISVSKLTHRVGSLARLHVSGNTYIKKLVSITTIQEKYSNASSRANSYDIQKN
jgi:hypothetical protein